MPNKSMISLLRKNELVKPPEGTFLEIISIFGSLPAFSLKKVGQWSCITQNSDPTLIETCQPKNKLANDQIARLLGLCLISFMDAKMFSPCLDANSLLSVVSKLSQSHRPPRSFPQKHMGPAAHGLGWRRYARWWTPPGSRSLLPPMHHRRPCPRRKAAGKRKPFEQRKALLGRYWEVSVH